MAMNRICQGTVPLLFVVAVVCIEVVSEAQDQPSHVKQSHDVATDIPDIPDGLLHGIALPAKRVSLSAPIEGVLMEMLVEEGQNVEKGEILAIMDNRVEKAAVEVAKIVVARNSQLDHAKQELSLAGKNLERMTSLYSSKTITKHEFDAANARYGKANAGVAAAVETRLHARKTLEFEMARLEAHNIRAPFKGRVIQIRKSPGSTLTRHDEFLSMVSLNLLEVDLHLPISFYGRLKVGQFFSLPATEPVSRRLTGKLKYIEPTIDSATRTFRCVFILDNKDRKYPSGFTVGFDRKSWTDHVEILSTKR